MNKSAMSKLVTSESATENAVQYAPLVIVGGGVAGATAALLLAKNLPELQITLIDAGQPKPINPEQHDSRVFALSPASIFLLEQAGAWQHIARRADYTGMQVWSENAAGELRFGSADANSGSTEILGSMVEPSVISAGLYAEIANYANITLLSETKVMALDNISGSYIANNCSEPQKPHWQLSLSNGTKLLTPLVVAADGRNSFIRREAGIDVDTLDYKKTAIACAIKTEKPHQGIARQVFLPTGPLALLPLADLDSTEQGCWQSIVWTLPTNMALDVLAQEKLENGVLAKQLAAKSQYELGNVLEAKNIASFLLQAMHADNYVKDGLALIGDAAHGVHPLAGQGLNIGLLDVAVLTDGLISEYQRSRGTCYGSLQQLQRYEQARRGQNAAMMHSFSLIGWAFGGQNYPAGHVVEWLRSEAVQLGNRLPLVTDWFNRQAGGLGELAKTRWAS